MLSFSPLRPWRPEPSHGRAGLAVCPAARVHKGTGQCERPGRAAARRGRSARGWGLLVAAGCVGCKASGTASPHSRVPGKPARGSRAVACGFGREMRRDRVQAGPGRGWPRAPMAQPQSFGSEWRLSEGGGGGDRLFWRQPRLRDFGGSGGVNSLFCSCAGGGAETAVRSPRPGGHPQYPAESPRDLHGEASSLTQTQTQIQTPSRRKQARRERRCRCAAPSAALLSPRPTP